MDQPQVVTLGCRLNAAESEMMKTLVIEEKLKNAIIINTCAVTAEAERQARQAIRHLKKENPDAFIIVTGCAAQLRPHVFAAMNEVSRVVGNGFKTHKESFSPDLPNKVYVGPMSMSKTADAAPMMCFEGKAKAFLPVQNGCNHYCTFCTIPLARGPSQSVPLDSIIKQAHNVIDHGVQEIVLTGVDLTSYQSGEYTFAHMVKALLDQVSGIKRLRLSSLDSIEIDENLLTLILSEQRLLPYLHLSLQSGSNFILTEMKRRHLREHAITLCRHIKKQRPDMALGVDFIAGFPGETEEMFQETLLLVDECDLTHLHVFPFSKRPGTPASRMLDQIPHNIIKERARRLREKGTISLSSWLKSHVGKEITLLAEQPLKGHSDDFSMVHLLSAITPNTVVRAKVVDSTASYLIAQPILNPGDFSGF